MRCGRTVPRFALSLVAASALATAACADASSGSGDRDTAWAAVVDTIGDTIRVHTTAGRVWPSDARLESEVAIGVLDGAPEYQFGDVRALAVDRQDRLYVLDGHGPVIRVYGRDGTYLHDVGREGEGPGEYKQPDSGLSFLADGRLALRDPGNGRISLFETDGTYADSWPLAGGLSTSSAMIATQDGALLTPVIKNLGAPLAEWERGFARYRADGTVDTLDVPDLGFEEPMVSGQSENSSSQTTVPFSPSEHVEYSPLGYFVAGVSDAYAFRLLERDSPVVEISMDVEPVPVHPEEAAVRRAQIEKNFRDNFPGWRWNGPPVPDTKPAFEALLVSDEGRIWVKAPAPSERFMDEEARRAEEERSERPVNPFRAPIRFDVFEPTGEYLGRVRAPDGMRLYPRPVIRDRQVWAVVTDELDVARVHRFRVAFDAEAAEMASEAGGAR